MPMQNLGWLDRGIRLVLGAVVATLPGAGVVSGAFVWLAFALAAVLIVTAAIGFCPLYRPLHIDTRPKLTV